MKHAFTTLGCPDWDLETVIERASRYGYDGIDFRGLGPHRRDAETGRYVECQLDITTDPRFTTELARTRDAIRTAGLEVAGLSSSARFAHLSPSDQGHMLDEAKRYIALAAELGCGIVRVFGGSFGKQGLDLAAATDNLVAALSALAPVARDANVVIAVETHDEWIDSAKIRPVFERVDSPSVGALWDVHHPYRVGGEAPSRTWELIGQWVVYTHVKDSVVEGEGHRYCHTGEGTIPLAEIVGVLARGGYDGYLTYEWEKIWHPDIPDADEAFPRHVEALRAIVEGAA